MRDAGIVEWYPKFCSIVHMCVEGEPENWIGKLGKCVCERTLRPGHHLLLAHTLFQQLEIILEFTPAT